MLELGTGTGLATAWLLDGMDRASRLISIETDEAVPAIAREALGADDCVSFVQADGGDWLRQAAPAQFDLIFADAWPGKDSHLDEALGALIGTAPLCLAGIAYRNSSSQEAGANVHDGVSQECSSPPSQVRQSNAIIAFVPNAQMEFKWNEDCN